MIKKVKLTVFPLQRAARNHLLLGLSLSLGGCALFAPKDYSKVTEGEWRGKALVRDLKESKTGIIHLKIKAIDNQKLRMDIFSPLGAHMASVLMLGEDVQILNLSEKTLYKTKSSREAFSQLIRVPLEPQVMYNILFDRAIDNKNWSCNKSESGPIRQCKELKSRLTIEWVRREGAKRSIELRHPAATVQMNLDSFEPKVTDSEKSFQMKAPATFQVKSL